MFEIGSSLREARLRQGLDLRDAESATKIRSKYLKALEDERFDLLPAETYIRGFLRAYAEHLGLDGQLYVDEYNSRYAVDEESAPARARRMAATRAPRRRRRGENGLVLTALAAIAVVTALVIAAWRFGGTGEDDPGIPGLDAAGTTTAAASPPPPPPPAPGTVRIQLEAIGNSFVEVHATDQTGRQLYSGTLERGQTKRFEGRQLWLNVGIPRNVMVTVNGKPLLLERRVPTVYVATPKGLKRSKNTR